MLQEFIYVRDDKALRRIHPADVLCLATEKNYTRIFLTDDTHYMVRATLAGALKRLPRNIFIRIHRSYVVSLLHVDDIYKDYVVIKRKEVPIGRQYYRAFVQRLNVIE